MISLPVLARLASKKSTTHPRCELCGGPLLDRHRHVVERGVRGIQCACQPCALLFTREAARFRTIPDRIVRGTLTLTAQGWAQLGIPVGLAFCYRDSIANAGIVCYPGPAGLTDASLAPEVWNAIREATSLADALEEDVEALLVRGRRGVETLAIYLVPISAGYELVGRLRGTWEGFSGGERAERELDAFFDELDHRGGAT